MNELYPYNLLEKQLTALAEMTNDLLAMTANLSAALYSEIPQLNWVGFYRVKNDALLLGAFQGKPACVELKNGGVCVEAWKTAQTVVVPDVHKFKGHIACDSASNSEIVVPIFYKNKVWGVLDVDSPTLNRFGNHEKQLFEFVARLIESKANFEILQ